MTPSINLLPWRDMQREALRRRFFYKLAFVVFLAVLCVLVMLSAVGHQQSQQEIRNARLQQEIDVLNAKLRDFSKREVERDELYQRLMLVNALQKQRNNATKLFNLLPQVIPDGVVLDKVVMNAGKVTLEGRSRDNAELASLLALLESNAGAKNVQIHSIVNEPGSTAAASTVNAAVTATFVAKKFRATFTLADFTVLTLPEESADGR